MLTSSAQVQSIRDCFAGMKYLNNKLGGKKLEMHVDRYAFELYDFDKKCFFLVFVALVDLIQRSIKSPTQKLYNLKFPGVHLQSPRRAKMQKVRQRRPLRWGYIGGFGTHTEMCPAW